MEYGVFSTAFGKRDVEGIAAGLAANGIRKTQFYPLVAGKWLSAADFTDGLIRNINRAFAAHGVSIVAAGAGNRFISSDEGEAKKALENALRWVETAPRLGANIIVTEAGTAHKTEFWTDVPENHTAETWDRIVEIYRTIARRAQDYGVTVGIEPHFASGVRDAKELRRVLDDVGEPNFKAVLDPANSVTAENAGRQEETLEELFFLLGRDFVLAHAKDARLENGAAVFGPAGSGVLPYGVYLALLKAAGYEGPLLLEYVGEDFQDVIGYIKRSAVPPFLRPIAEGDPVLYDAIGRLQDIHHGDTGLIPKKYRLLLSVVADALALHPAGTVACAREALKAGAAKGEIIEALRVVYAAGGLPPLLESADVYRELTP
jgi:sugar phosphate isomerase/epimerase/alkylhydroperoxidase/carboxymuconolactone decarboxylase family protein YurZ